MIQTPEDRRPPMTPQLALRVAIIGSVALALFAIIFFRLWFLQVLSGEQYVRAATVNRVRQVGVPAQRGEILDKSGSILVDSRQALAVQISPTDLPASPAAQNALYRRLAGVLGFPARATRCRIPTGPVKVGDHLVETYRTARLARIACDVTKQLAILPYANVTLKTDVPRQVQYYLAERQQTFPAVVVQKIFVRNYPLGGLGAQLFGTVGPINAQEIASNYPATGGSFIAMNPQDGSIYAMGSLPTFNPKVFTGNLSQRTYKLLTSAASHEPLLNRAIASTGPTGSTFKPITATAALESGNWTIGSSYDDTGSFQEQPGVFLHNAGNVSNGPLDLVNAIRVSSDTFFYNLGARTNVSNPLATPQGGPLQTWARRFGIGSPTGVDIPGESAGTLPSPAFRSGRNRLEAQCDTATGPFKGKPKHPAGGCGIADGTNRPWSIGDNINLAVGQGDVQATPLQLAVVYAALANGGTIVRPHVGASIQNQDGTVLQNISPPASSHIAINPIYLETIRQGLRDAASLAGGTSAAVFSKFPEQVYGKTGTAQYTGQNDYSWYACFVPASATTKPIVVVVHVEQGGFGAVAAAPVAREILSQWFFGKPGPYLAGSSHTL